MKTIKFFRAVIVLAGLLLSACAPSVVPSSSAPVNVGGGKAVSEVIFTGVIESMDGSQWVIDGQTITVDQSVLRDGPFAVGDTVKVEASVAGDGTVTAQRVETPAAADLAGNDNSAPTEAPTAAPSDATAQPLVFDDSGTEAFGTLETLTDTSITVGGETFVLAPGAELNGQFLPGDLVKLHFTTNADGTFSVTEVEIADPTQLGDNSNDDNSNDDNSNANANGNDDNSNDDNGNDDNSNDDNGSDDNSDDDNGDNNSNDDHGGSDDNGDDDDNSSGGNDNG